MIKVCMILKKEWLLANYWEGYSPPTKNPLAVASALRSNKPKNIYRFTISVKWNARKCHDFINQFIY
jgi:hypothetical protein